MKKTLLLFLALGWLALPALAEETPVPVDQHPDAGEIAPPAKKPAHHGPAKKPHKKRATKPRPKPKPKRKPKSHTKKKKSRLAPQAPAEGGSAPESPAGQ